MYYAKSTGGFYDPAIHGDNIPADAVEITGEEHASLMAAQEAGKVIQADKNGKPVAVAPQFTQAELVTNAVLQIDVDTDAIYGAVLGNRAQEYTLAEADATAYKAAGYTGTVPASVQCWATTKSWTAKQAADDILATAAAWRSAQAAIRAQRLSSKEAVRTANDAAGVTTAMAAWAGFVTTIKGQLGI